MRQRASIREWAWQEGAIADRPAHDRWMNSPSSGRIQPHYSTVMIAPLSTNSSHADCRPERSFFLRNREFGRLGVVGAISGVGAFDFEFWHDDRTWSGGAPSAASSLFTRSSRWGAARTIRIS